MSEKYDFNNKVVFITGASGGIGAACARAFYQQGASLALTDLSQESVDKLAGEFDSARVLALGLDVTDMQATKDVVQQIVDKFGRLDIAIANAGISWFGTPGTIAGCAENEFEKIVEVDLFGVWRTIRAALPEVQKQQGQIVITSSVYAFMNGVVNAPYAASKAAVEMLGRALRAELASTGTTASVLYPGWVATPIAKVAFGGHDITTQLIQKAFPSFLRTPIQPEDIADALLKGLTRRAPAIIAPGRWKPLSLLRGFLSPLSDKILAGNQEIQGLIRKIEDDYQSKS